MPATASTSPPPGVLLVDDDDLLRRSTARSLRADGYSVIEATDAVGAEAALVDHEFDLVLLDIVMPGVDGLAFLRTIRGRDLDVPVVVMTGFPNVESAVETVRLGAVDYLSKPVDPAKLHDVVARATTLGRMGRAKRSALEDLDPATHRAGDRAGLETAFESCLATLWMAFQPIVRHDGQLIGYEALLRSVEPAMPNPNAVLDAAEQLKRLPDLGRHVRRLIAAGVASSDDTVFVNLHARDLEDDELLDESVGLGPMARRVVLEITERAALADVDAARARVARLREFGYRIAIDDLGAGYAGLSSFTTLEPDVCKLDMSLVRDVDRTPKRQRLVRSMTSLCRDLGIEVVAEGVETEGELNTLIDAGCDLFQGYLLARPGPPFPAVTWPPGAHRRDESDQR